MPPFQRQHSYTAASIGSESFSDTGSGEQVPLLYDARGRKKQQQMQQMQQHGAAVAAAGIGCLPGRYVTSSHPLSPVAPGLADKPASYRCPRCRKEFLSTINQRRCIASHLGGKQQHHGGGGAGGAGAGRAAPPRATNMLDAGALAAFWDSLGEAEQRDVLNVRAEQWGEQIAEQVAQAMLHRERGGVLAALSDAQRRMHQAGKMLHDQVRGGVPLALTGDQLMR